jgi:hypothetical protein
MEQKPNLLLELSIETNNKHPYPDGRTDFLLKKYTEETQLFKKIIENKPSENIIQSFLETHPIILLHAMLDGFYPAASTRSALFTKVQLGAEFQTDFAYCNHNSSGVWWTFIELERPDLLMFTKNGNPSKYLTHAIRQVLDWQSWLVDHVEYAKSELSGLFDTETRNHLYLNTFRRPPNAIIVIGRRNDLTTDMNRRRMQLCIENPRLEIMTYDRLFDDYWVDKEEVINAGNDEIRNIKELRKFEED